ncbi:peptidoglycan-binding protein [Salipaludibacillus sp. LMS25]|uniref:peptidoglycan-binding protein n=1 Tax=Salipaludibacillus sp. LMS25 TaxID=2924031 RepID=UPI0020D164C4|nr:peptidoglycan-binding protein [Salipaludibacillus sp. LMS25]UTR16220.1 peptidoglycan-binding protein [Salipaludibacillus sp. LMS25]
MSKKVLRQFTVVNLALLLFFSAFTPALASSPENSGASMEKNETSLTIEPNIFNQDIEDSITVTSKGDYESITLYLYDEISNELIGKIAEGQPSNEGSFRVEWDYTLIDDGNQKDISLDNSLYSIGALSLTEGEDLEEAVNKGENAKEYFFHNNTSPSITFKSSITEEVILEENKIEGTLSSPLIEFGISPLDFTAFYTFEQNGTIYKKDSISFNEDGNFLLEEKLLDGDTDITITVEDPASNSTVIEFSVLLEESLVSSEKDTNANEETAEKNIDEKAEVDTTNGELLDSENGNSDILSNGEFQEDADFSTSSSADTEVVEKTNNSFYEGASGEHVRQLKLDLTKLGFGNFPENPSLTYGSVTMNVVEEFQKAYNLPVTGIADQATLEAIDTALSTAFYNGARGDHVYELKLNLTKLGFGNFPENPSNLFGSVTMSVVEEFQKAYNLPVTGIPDQATLEAIDTALSTAFYNGARGDHVYELKLNLTKLGFGNFSENPSNLFGSVTIRVVEEFQKAYNLEVTGIPNKATLDAIQASIDKSFYEGAVGPHIVQLKLDLTRLGFGNFPNTPSNRYGNVTMRVVEEFQKAYNLEVTGIADQATLDMIADRLENGFYNGAQGPHVVELKQDLTTLGFGNFPKNPSNTYGSVTIRVVEEFQKAYNLPITGIADHATLYTIQEALNNGFYDGASGNHVVELKQNLTKLGFGSFPDNPSNSYGNVTMRVVKEFQTTYGLPTTGIATPSTIDKIDNLLVNGFYNGVSGDHVRELKQNLTLLGFGNFPANPSTSYGTVTMRVVEDFQAYYGLPVTGYVRPDTLAYIDSLFNSRYSTGKSGSHVVALKNDLSTLGYGNFPKNPSSSYGSVTARVVSDFQAENGLAVNGIGDGPTLEKIAQLIKEQSNAGPLAGKVIVLDAGHGGSDPGAIAGGMQEKELALDVSLRAQKLLEEAGATVIMTRTTDVFLTLAERAAIANSSNADAFLSVHANAFNGSANGTETYWYHTYQSNNSQRLANSIQSATLSKLGLNNRGVKSGNFHVIRETRIPSALLELGFMDHPGDAAILRQSSSRQRAAEAIRDGMIDYFN